MSGRSRLWAHAHIVATVCYCDTFHTQFVTVILSTTFSELFAFFIAFACMTFFDIFSGTSFSSPFVVFILQYGLVRLMEVNNRHIDFLHLNPSSAAYDVNLNLL